MDTREKRIFLRLCSKSEQQKAAMEKLDNYDKRRYDSPTDYIVQAILAYGEPVVIGEDRLRQILREEREETERAYRSQPPRNGSTRKKNNREHIREKRTGK